ncbi:phosphatase PAP2 family protein [soil metagenome]
MNPLHAFLDWWVRVDDSSFSRVNELARDTGRLHGPALWFATYGVVLFAAMLLAGYLLARRSGELTTVAASLWAPLGVLLAVGVNQPIGSAVGEARPYDSLPHVLALVPHSADFSFPSDHAVMAGAVAMGLVVVHRRLAVAAAVAAVLMAATRVYVGAHFPGDVVVGLLLGAAVTFLGRLVFQPVITLLLVHLGRTRLRWLVGRAAQAPADDRVPARSHA